jgi:hypothetical protein
LRRAIVVSLPLVIACGPGQQPRLETEHLTFHGELDGICGAFGALYEREVDRIEHELGRGLLEPVDVHVVMSLEEVERRCPEGTVRDYSSLEGCVVSNTEVIAFVDGISLQLADVTRRQYGVRGIPFIEKALPRMIGYARPTVGVVVSAEPWNDEHAIAPQLAYDWSDEALARPGLAMHFLHWAEQAYGLQAVQAWLWSDAVLEGEDVEAAFAEATGQTIAVAQARWSDEAEAEAYFDDFCYGLPAPPLPAEGLVGEGSLCCDDPGVEQAHPGLLSSAQQCFTVASDIVVDVELLAGEGELVLRPDRCLSSWDKVSPLVLSPGESATVTLTPCRWKALVFGPERCEAGGEVRYAITPS